MATTTNQPQGTVYNGSAMPQDWQAGRSNATATVSPQTVYQPSQPGPKSALPTAGADARVLRSANWFFWIAGLSLINTVVALSGSGSRFVVGLGITRIVDELAQGGKLSSGVGFVISLAACGLFGFLGVRARTGLKPAFLAGMAFYGLDTLLTLVAGDIFSTAFHGLALYFIFLGYHRLTQIEKASGPVTA